MNDFAPKASRNGKLVLQKIPANEVTLVGNQKSEIDNVDVITRSFFMPFLLSLKFYIFDMSMKT